MHIVASSRIPANVVDYVSVICVVAASVITQGCAAGRTAAINVCHVMDMIALYKVVRTEVVNAIGNSAAAQVEAYETYVAGVVAYKV